MSKYAIMCAIFALLLCSSSTRHWGAQAFPDLFYAAALPAAVNNNDVFHKAELFDVAGGTKKKDGSLTTDAKKYIPQNVFFAIRNISHEKPQHHKEFAAKNPNWKLHYYDNDMKDDFMEKEFAGTSLLWAYQQLNPEIGCAKPELWRLAVLYKFGGMYMDDDATVGTPLDEVVQFTDKLLLGEDAGEWDDRCWQDNFPLSNHSLVARFGNDPGHQSLFHNKWFFNWVMFSAPGHPVIKRIMEHIVTLIRAEYSELFSLIKMSAGDHKGKLLMCASTFPITVTTREIILENKYSSDALGIRTFTIKQYDCNMKAWNNDWAPDRWVKAIHNQRKPYLISQEVPPADVCAVYHNGQLVQASGQQEVFIILDGSKHSFPNWDTFVGGGWDADHIHPIEITTLSKIPKGEDVSIKGVNTYLRSTILSRAAEFKAAADALYDTLLSAVDGAAVGVHASAVAVHTAGADKDADETAGTIADAGAGVDVGASIGTGAVHAADALYNTMIDEASSGAEAKAGARAGAGVDTGLGVDAGAGDKDGGNSVDAATSVSVPPITPFSARIGAAEVVETTKEPTAS